jgi:hypothetical protein
MEGSGQDFFDVSRGLPHASLEPEPLSDMSNNNESIAGDIGFGTRVAAIAAASFIAPAVAANDKRSFEIDAAAQADLIQDLSGRLDPDWDDAFRPSRIGIDGQFGGDGQSSLSVKQSRFGIKGTMPTGSGLPFDFRFELDLFGTDEDAGQTTFRLRHAYGQWGSILAGQTDSLFMDGDVSPNTIDYWGPSGMVFYRNVQFRWTAFRNTNSHFAIAIERPGNDVDPGNIRLIEGLEGVQVQSNEEVPDITAQYRFGGEWGHVQAAGILRHVGFEVRPDADSEWRSGHERGWGINLASSIATIGKDEIQLQAVHGEGIASYMNDGGMDLAPNAAFDQSTVTNLDARAVPLTGVLAYYDHYWDAGWSSSIGYSYTEVDNTNFQDAGAFHKGDYASINVLTYPGAHLMLGGELLWGKRTNNDGASDDAVRVQFTIRYTFDVSF